MSVEPDGPFDLDEVVPALNPATRAVSRLYEQARAALTSITALCDRLVPIESDFMVRVSDVEGYVEWGDHLPRGWTPLDVAVLRGASLHDNPDQRVLSDAEWSRFVRIYDRLSDEDRKAFMAAMNAHNDPKIKALMASALAAGLSVGMVAGFGDELEGLTAEELDQVIGLGGKYESVSNADWQEHTSFSQQTDQTCGPNSLIHVAAMLDPTLALWLVTGRLVEGHVPAYIGDRIVGGDTVEERLKSLEVAVRKRANNVFTGSPWIGAFGISPWGATSELSRTGVDFCCL